MSLTIGALFHGYGGIEIAIGVDRGRGPTVEESNKMDATPKLTPAAGA